MSVKDRIEDARILYENDRREGALLSVLIAVAATSRKRYPRDKMGDRKAFTMFVAEEMRAITGVIGNLQLKFRDKLIPAQDLLYEYVRCELAHEAILPEDVRFECSTSFTISVTDDCVTLSDAWIQGLANAVCGAPENEGDFD